MAILLAFFPLRSLSHSIPTASHPYCKNSRSRTFYSKPPQYFFLSYDHGTFFSWTVPWSRTYSLTVSHILLILNATIYRVQNEPGICKAGPCLLTASNASSNATIRSFAFSVPADSRMVLGLIPWSSSSSSVSWEWIVLAGWMSSDFPYVTIWFQSSSVKLSILLICMRVYTLICRYLTISSMYLSPMSLSILFRFVI